MAKYRISISSTEQKILFAKSGNVCAFPGCDLPIIAEVGDENKPLAEIAHMLAYEDDGPRSDPNLPVEDRNKASNLILLCPTHHTLVDKFEYQFNIHVLREMKMQHEQKFGGSSLGIETNKLTKEPLHASLLPLSRLPLAVFSADTPFRKSNILDLFDVLNTHTRRSVLYAFELRDKKLYTFHDLRTPNNPFRGAYDQSTVEGFKSSELWKTDEGHRLYVALLNRALRNFLKGLDVAYDARHYRYYFLPDRLEIRRRFSYMSLSGRQTTKSIVNNPITKATGKPKSYWVHLAANLAFQHIAPRQWVLTIRPERHLTKDGFEPYTHSSIGSKITRIKSTLYNWQYLQEIQLWREFLSNAQKRRILRFGSQAIVIENNLLKEDIEWLGIAEDQKNFVSQEHPEDLFTLVEINILGEEEEEFYDDVFLDEYEE